MQLLCGGGFTPVQCPQPYTLFLHLLSIILHVLYILLLHLYVEYCTELFFLSFIIKGSFVGHDKAGYRIFLNLLFTIFVHHFVCTCLRLIIMTFLSFVPPILGAVGIRNFNYVVSKNTSLTLAFTNYIRNLKIRSL